MENPDSENRSDLSNPNNPETRPSRSSSNNSEARSSASRSTKTRNRSTSSSSRDGGNQSTSSSSKGSENGSSSSSSNNSDGIPWTWVIERRSRQDHFTQTTDLHDTTRLPETWSSLETLIGLSSSPILSDRSTSVVEASEKFCDRCADIDFAALASSTHDMENAAFRLGYFSEIVRSLDCPLCCLFSMLIERFLEGVREDNERSFYLISFPTSALYGDDWVWKDPIKAIGETISFSIIDFESLEERSKISQAELVRAMGCISPVVADGNFDDFQARLLSPIADLELLKSWLNYCDYHHPGTCNSSSELHRCATNVMDCRTKTIVPLEDEHRYLALSYVWGSSNRASASEATIEDAMFLTVQLGYSYLWIDRYCIPQEESPERRLQISQMGRIFAGAEMTIIAAVGKDPSAGLPGVRSRPRGPSKVVTINDRVHAFVPPDPAFEIQSSFWNSRGWTYQESILSRRRLIVCEQQVYFECEAMHCYEAMQSPLHLLHSTESNKFSAWNEPGLFSSNKWSKYPLDQLFDYLTNYTTRNLTYPSDILNGMLGIFESFDRGQKADQLRSVHSATQIAGVPILRDNTLTKWLPLDAQVRHSTEEEQFMTGLRWNLKEPSKKRAGFPSWSWTGWDGIISPRYRYAGYIDNTFLNKFRFDYSQKLQSSSSQLRDLQSVLVGLRSGELLPGDIPLLQVDGECVAVRLARPKKEDSESEETGSREDESGSEQAGPTKDQDLSAEASEEEDEDPNDLVALIELDDRTLTCPKFTRDNNDPLPLNEVLKEQYNGLMLGLAQGTYFAHGEGDHMGGRVLSDDFTLVILVLRKRGDSWERFGLIEYRTSNVTRDGPEEYLDVSKIRTTRQCLWLC